MVIGVFDSQTSSKVNENILSSNLIRRLHADSGSQTHKIPYLYYFFNFRDPSTQTCENFLRSLLSQLIHSLPDVPDVVVELYSQHKSGTLRPSIRDLTDCFIAVVNELDEVRSLVTRLSNGQSGVTWSGLLVEHFCGAP